MMKSANGRIILFGKNTSDTREVDMSQNRNPNQLKNRNQLNYDSSADGRPQRPVSAQKQPPAVPPELPQAAMVRPDGEPQVKKTVRPAEAKKTRVKTQPASGEQSTEKKTSANSGKTHRRKPVNPTKAKNRKINQMLMYILIGVTAVTVVALIVNTVLVVRASSVSNKGTEEGMSANTGQSMKNEVYIIGNNPTDIEKEYFQKLTDALKGGNPEEIAEAVVYNFVTDYFTWTNKDGNYEVGGLQYIFAEKYSKFEEWNRWYHYSNMDLFISQYGRPNLIRVKEVTTEKPTKKTDDFTVMSVDPVETYPCYQVQVAWTYDDASVDTSVFPNRMRFQVVDHNGRFEIVEFYDMPSVEAWEAENGGSESSSDQAGTTDQTADSGTAQNGSEG